MHSNSDCGYPPGLAPREVLDAEPDPLKRLRLQHGEHPSGSGLAMREAHPAIASAWFQPDEDAGVGIIELWFRGDPTPEERSAAARAAYEVLRAWYPELDSWDVRARPGRERNPDPRKALRRRETELDLLARARAKRLRLGEGR